MEGLISVHNWQLVIGVHLYEQSLVMENVMLECAFSVESKHRTFLLSCRMYLPTVTVCNVNFDKKTCLLGTMNVPFTWRMARTTVQSDGLPYIPHESSVFEILPERIWQAGGVVKRTFTGLELWFANSKSCYEIWTAKLVTRRFCVKCKGLIFRINSTSGHACLVLIAAASCGRTAEHCES